MSDTGETLEDTDSMTVSEASDAVHRKLGTTGVRLNEAHAHLSALKSAEIPDSEVPAEVVRAEARALIDILEQSRSELERAIQYAEATASELDIENGSDNTDNDGSDAESSPVLLWNAVPASQHSPASDE